ncbi:hypothetical protein B0H10DRAFT_2206257 [Mycena sp. CBHHK59/15]|nr:hypothetical protein B0H10DRAFT_2206257 [Mycena sp. CBHHK59/15]
MKPNAYNAFKAEKAAERREEGSKGMTAPELHAAYHAEYDNMTDEEKAALAQRHQEQREEIPKIRRDTPQGRMRDMSNVVRNIQLLMIGLMYRVGIEGFFCIVRNSSDFFMPPQWYFTSQEVERYMPLAVGRKWDTGSAGTKIEAFAVAGCDTLNLLHTNGQRVAWVKAEIRDMVLSGLVEVSKKQLKMEYVHYREDIVVKHGLELIGWTADKFVSPSELSSSLHVLGKLWDTLKEGTCKWVKLSPAEHQARKDAWKADVADGKVVPKARNPRSDIGTKRKHSDNDNDADTNADEVHDSGNEERNDDTQPASPIIEEPDDGADAAASTTPAAPPPKRRKTNAASAPAAARKPRANKENQGTGRGGLKRAGKDPKDNADAATKRAHLAARDTRRGPKAVPKLCTRRGMTSPALIPDNAGAEAQGSSGTAEVAPVATPMVTTIPFAIDPALLAVAFVVSGTPWHHGRLPERDHSQNGNRLLPPHHRRVTIVTTVTPPANIVDVGIPPPLHSPPTPSHLFVPALCACSPASSRPLSRPLLRPLFAPALRALGFELSSYIAVALGTVLSGPTLTLSLCF